MKKLLTSILILITVTGSSQTNYGVLEMGAGYNIKSNSVSGSLQVGARIGNVYVSGNMIVHVSNKGYIPIIFPIDLGYNIGQFQPFISYGWQTIGSEREAAFKGTPYAFTNGWRVGYGASYYLKSIPLSFTAQKQGKEIILSTGMYVNF